MTSQQCPPATLYDLVTKHWPQAVSSSPVVPSRGVGQMLLDQLAELRNSVVEPNAAWFRNHTFSGAIMFPLSSDMVSPLISVTPPSGTLSAPVQSGNAEPTTTAASLAISNNGGRLRRRFPQGQLPGAGNSSPSPSGPDAPTTTTTVQAKVPGHFVYIYHSEVVRVHYAAASAGAPPSTLVANVSNRPLLEPSHTCNAAKAPWQPYKQALPADLAGSLFGCTTSPAKPAGLCFLLNVKAAPDCNIPGNCYGEPASLRSVMQVMARAMPSAGFPSQSDDPASSSTRLPMYAWIAIGAGVLALIAGVTLCIIRRKRTSGVGRSSSNSAYAKLAAPTPAHHGHSLSSPASTASHMLSPPAATAHPPLTSPSAQQNKLHPSLDRTQRQPPLVVPAARRPASQLLTSPVGNTNLILTTQTLEKPTSTPTSPVPIVADTLMHVDTTPVPLPAHLSTGILRLLTASSLAHPPSRAFVGLSGDLAADLSLQDVVDGWVSVLDLSLSVARSRSVPLALVGKWVASAVDRLATLAPADARASPHAMVAWYTRLASDTKAVGLAAGGKPADPEFVRTVVLPLLVFDDRSAAGDADRVKVATTAIVAFVRIKSLRPFAVLSEAQVGELVDASVVKVVEEYGRASLSRRDEAERAPERVMESVFPGVVDVVDGVVLAHARVSV